MEKDKKFRALAVAAICVAIVGVSVAYAALQASLTITGTATVNTQNSWSVTATDLSCTASGYATFTSESGPVKSKTFTVATGTNQINWDATFVAPKDKVVCELTWTNGGSIDAAVTDLVKSVSGDAANNFTYTVVMGSTDLTDTVPTNKYLAAGTNKKVTITVTFDAGGTLSGDALSALSGKTATFTASFGFVQALANTTYTEL